jgi:thiamine-phosphate pyrophosphorylase
MPLPFRAYLITDRRLAPGEDLPRLVHRALCRVPPGAVAVQLREKDLGAGALLSQARALREVTRRAGALLLVNDRVDVALAAGADGVHLAGDSLPAAVARRLLGPERLLGASAHDLAQARAARDGGCDFATFSPIYHTPSKAAYGPPQGLDALREAARDLAPFPLVALGGVTLERAAACRAAGAAAAAAIRAVLAAPEPGEAARQLAAACE